MGDPQELPPFYGKGGKCDEEEHLFHRGRSPQPLVEWDAMGQPEAIPQGLEGGFHLVHRESANGHDTMRGAGSACSKMPQSETQPAYEADRCIDRLSPHAGGERGHPPKVGRVVGVARLRAAITCSASSFREAARVSS